MKSTKEVTAAEQLRPSVLDLVTNERQQMIEACACPRRPGDQLAKPRCLAKEVIGEYCDKPILFVSYPVGLVCSHALEFGFSQICRDRMRIQVFLKYKS